MKILQNANKIFLRNSLCSSFEVKTQIALTFSLNLKLSSISNFPAKFFRTHPSNIKALETSAAFLNLPQSLILFPFLTGTIPQSFSSSQFQIQQSGIHLCFFSLKFQQCFHLMSPLRLTHFSQSFPLLFAEERERFFITSLVYK